jgi:hypothetical protein
MQRTLFLSIMNTLSETSPYFTERHDATDRIGLTLLQKCTTTLRQLAYGMTADMIDEYMKLEKTSALKCLEYYCADIVDCYGAELLRRSTIVDTQRLLAKTEEYGFPGMLGSIDYILTVVQLSGRLAMPIYTEGHQTSYNHS